MGEYYSRTQLKEFKATVHECGTRDEILWSRAKQLGTFGNMRIVQHAVLACLEPRMGHVPRIASLFAAFDAAKFRSAPAAC